MAEKRALLLLPDVVVVSARAADPSLPLHGVAIVGSGVDAVAPHAALRERYPGAEILELPGMVVMPGLINAHQHGRAVSSFQLGSADDLLELFMHRNRIRAHIDPGLNAALACARFIAGGVTGVLQANTPLGTGDYATELRSTIAAYDKAGLRAAIAVGCMDRGDVVYPQEAAPEFMAGLPDELRPLVAPAAQPVYAGDAEATIRLADGLLAQYGSNSRIVIGHGPAGPQWVGDGMLRRIGEHAAANDLFVHFHGLESLAQVPAVASHYPEGMLARLKSLKLATPRCSIGHAVWMSELDARIAADTGVTFVRNASSNLRLRTGIAPLAEYMRLGVKLAIGTDNFCLGDDEDLFAEMRLAGALARSPFWDAPPPPSAAQLLGMATVGGGAAAGFAGVGELVPGAAADLIAVRLADIRGAYLSERIPLLDAIVLRGAGRDVALTMVDGRILYRDGQFLTLDVPGLLRAAATGVESASRDAPAELVERLVAEVGKFYGRRTRLAGLPAHWQPLALDRRRCH